MSWREKAINNQLSMQCHSFYCIEPSTEKRMRRHRMILISKIIRETLGADVKVVDAGGGHGELGNFIRNYTNWDLLDGHDIQKSIPGGDVIVFSDVLEHVVDLKKTLGNVKAEYVLISVPRERDFPPSIDHCRRLDWQEIRELTDWKLIGKWFWVMRPRFWRIRKLLQISAFAEEEITLWST